MRHASLLSVDDQVLSRAMAGPWSAIAGSPGLWKGGAGTDAKRYFNSRFPAFNVGLPSG
jgi:hypothetical protein